MKRLRHYATAIGVLLLFVAFSLLLPDTFPTARNLLNITQQVSMLAVVAITMTVPMAAGDFDLSVGSTASLAGVVAAVVFAAGWPLAAGLAAALATGVIAGLVNGWLVARIGILPFVATLGTLTVFSGAAFHVSGGRTLFGDAIPDDFADIARARVALDIGSFQGPDVPVLTLGAVAVLSIAWFCLERRPFGRHLYVIGNDHEAAELVGLPIRRLRTLAYVATGVGAALAGLMLSSRVASANPTLGAGLMLDAIAAVFLGMTMSARGEPRVIATLVGVLLLGMLDNGLTQLRMDSYVREMLVGVLILAAMAVALRARGG